MNTVTIDGRLGKEPQIRATKNGKPVASFSVAVNRKYVAPNGEEKEQTDWVNVVAWGWLAEASGNELKKGDRVIVVGRLSTRSYETPQGEKRYISEVVAEMIARPINTQQQSSGFEQFGTSRRDTEDIPF